MERNLSRCIIENFLLHLKAEDYSKGTINKYRGDIFAFFEYLPEEKKVTKEIAGEWKENLLKKGISVKTVNGKISAVNRLFSFLNWDNLKLKALKEQKRIFSDKNRELSKEEYVRLVRAAKGSGNRRLMLVLETICSTGIRVSELKYITVDAVKIGQALVTGKRKQRLIFMPDKLRKLLLKYIKEKNIKSGPEMT